MASVCQIWFGGFLINFFVIFKNIFNLNYTFFGETNTLERKDLLNLKYSPSLLRNYKCLKVLSFDIIL